MQMNADLKNAHLEVQAYFLEARINGNVVEFTAPELTTNDLINLGHAHRKNPNLNPFVFRSDMEVKVVVFVKDENGRYIGNEAPQNTDLTFEIEKIIEKEWVDLGGSGDDGLPYSSFRKVAEMISEFISKK